MQLLQNKTSVKYLLLGTLIAASVSLFLSTLFYRCTWQLHYVDFARQTPVQGLLLYEHFILGFLLTYIFPFGYQGGKAFPEGTRYGILMGGLSFLPVSLSIRAAWEVPLNFGFFLATLYTLIASSIIGVILARLHIRTSLKVQ